MKIQDFIQGRNISATAVRMYISRNPELFKGHIGKPKNIILDEVAIQLLEEKYPLPSPVQVIEDTSARKELSELQAKMIGLHEKFEKALEDNNRLVQENANLRLLQHKQLLLEETLLEKDNEISVLQENLQDAKDSIDEHQAELRQLKAELEAEKNKSWWDKLRKRR